jgi:signal transduction histidine kinase
LTLQLDDSGAKLVVQDNGRGFDKQHLSGGQLGLGIMRERAAEIGANFEITSQPGAGTCVTCTWRG